MSKTEGPWVIVPEDDDADGEEFGFNVVRDVPGDWSSVYELPTRAQAEAKRDELNKLEAVRDAAPELLAACKAFIATVRRAENCPCRMCAAYDQATNAIAKAEQA